MEDQKQTSFTFEIDNFSEKEAVIRSPNFSSGGCEWYVRVYPKGSIVDDHLSLYLHIANPESLSLGWKRRASYSFVLLNQSGKELCKIPESSCQLFCAQISGWGNAKTVPLRELEEKGFMKKSKLIVKVEVKVVEVVDEGDVTGKETLDYKGFQLLYSQVITVSGLFMKHPDIAVNFKPKSQLVKTSYMNILLALIKTLKKPPHSITKAELSDVQNELIDLTEAGFKLDWLKTKLDEISLERKKTNAGDEFRVQELIKNLNVELNEEKVKSTTSAAKVLSLEHTMSQLEDEVLDLKYEVSDLKDELNKEKGKFAAKFLSLEHTVSDLKDELNKNEVKSDTCAAKVLSLEQTVLNLRAELNKEKGVVCSWEVLDYADLRNKK